MDVLERRDWEVERAALMADTVKEFSAQAVQKSDEDIVRALRENGERALASSMEFAIRELGNVSHRTYHIVEDMEDAGEEQAVRRNNYLAWQAVYLRNRLSRKREKAKEFIAQVQRNDASRRTVCLLTEGLTEELLRALRRDRGLMDLLMPEAFERLIMGLIERMGFRVTATGSTHASDGGVDFVASPIVRTPLSTVCCGQVKHHQPGYKTGVADVDRLLGWRGGPFHIGLLVTNTAFTEDARFKADLENNKIFIRLRDGQDVTRWLQGSFGSATDLREIPDRVQLTPRFEVAVPKDSLVARVELWPLSRDESSG
jgi:hypothetical protein